MGGGNRWVDGWLIIESGVDFEWRSMWSGGGRFEVGVWSTYGVGYGMYFVEVLMKVNSKRFLGLHEVVRT